MDRCVVGFGHKLNIQEIEVRGYLLILGFITTMCLACFSGTEPLNLDGKVFTRTVGYELDWKWAFLLNKSCEMYVSSYLTRPCESEIVLEAQERQGWKNEEDSSNVKQRPYTQVENRIYFKCGAYSTVQ